MVWLGSPGAGVNSQSHDLQPNQRNMVFGQLEMSGMVTMFQTNALGPMMLMQELLPLLRCGHRPTIVNLSSRRGSIQNKKDGGNYGYCVSKAALNMLTRAAAEDVRQLGVVVVAIHPGVSQTDMGHPDATFPAASAAVAMLGLIDTLGLEQTGQFSNWDGSLHPW